MVHKAPIVDDHTSQEVELIRPTSPSITTTGNQVIAGRVVVTAEQLGIEIDQEEAATVVVEQQQQNNKPIMPPAPFQQMAPSSPGLGEEEGMEALWVEELVTPSPTSGGNDEEEGEEEVSTVPDDLKTKESTTSTRRSSSFFQRRIGTGLRWKRQSSQRGALQQGEQNETNLVGTTSSRKKVQKSIKLLDDDEQDPQLELPGSLTKKQRQLAAVPPPPPTEQRQSSFGNTEANEVRDGEASESSLPEKQRPTQSVAAGTLASDTSSKITMKSARARELLVAALHPDTEISEREGLAQAAFAEATAARVMMEGGHPPKGLDLVLRAASHKGRSAALAAAFSPENTEQQNRAQHYMDLILPIKAFPLVPAPPVPRAVPPNATVEGGTRGGDGDMSSLGFDHTFEHDSPRHTTATGGSGSRLLSPMSMSSLNEILDGPEDEQQDAPPKRRLSFLKKRTASASPNKNKNDPPEVFYAQQQGMMQDQEMPPPKDAPEMDDNGSWTDASVDEEGGRAASKASSSNKTRKKKRVFRLAKFAGLGGDTAAASSNASARSEKRRWLRRGKTPRGAVPDGPMVDHVPTPPPNVPYQSKPYQRYVANVAVDSGSRASTKTANTTQLSPVVIRTRDLDVMTQERLTSALLADETERLTSFDGVKMFGQNEKDDDEKDEEVAMDPPQDDEYLPKRSVKVDPQFVDAPEGLPAILTAKSWDSLVANDAARLEERPPAMVRRMEKYGMRSYDDDIAPPGDHYNRQMSPRSVESDTPDLVDKYSSTEEPSIDDKYSLEENDDGRFSVISGVDSFETTAAEDDPIMRLGSTLEEEEDEEEEEDDDEVESENEVPETPRRRNMALGLLARMKNRRRSQEKNLEEVLHEEEEEEEDDDDDDVLQQIPQTPSAKTETSRKPRRKLSLFRSFQSKKRRSKGELEDEVPIEEVEYDEAKQVATDLTMQQTGTLSDTDFTHEEIEIEEEEPEDIVGSPTTLNAAASEDTADSLIRRLRKQSGRVRRGKDPVSSSAAEVTRGIDP